MAAVTDGLIIYLDTSDYSRFADARAGREDPTAADALCRLLELKKSGDIKIAYSMPVLSELLQYEKGGRELTIRKAKIVEDLCDGWCFINPGRLLANQVRQVAIDEQLISSNTYNYRHSAVCSTDGWFPCISSIVDNPDNLRRLQVSSLLNELPQINRKNRRKLRKIASNITIEYTSDIGAALRQKFPFPDSFIKQSIFPYMNGTLEKEDFEQKLFSNICKPTSFVKIYYENYSGDKSLLALTSELGKQLQTAVTESREKLERLALQDDDRQKLILLSRQIGRNIVLSLGRSLLLNTLKEETEEIKISERVVRHIAEQNTLLSKLPYISFLYTMLPEYLSDNLGIRKGGGRTSNHSDFGDLLHAIHLPYCDFWRSDRHFAASVIHHSHESRCKVVRTLDMLVKQIETRLRNPVV